MKASELMIGDWVYLYGSPIKINIDDLGVIDRDDIYDNGEHCKPIPITPEILEKNGFELDKELTESDENKWYKHYFKDSLPIVNGVVAIYISFDEKDQNPELSYISMVESLPFKYVHQLQHILKDLQIEKILKV